MCRGRVWVIPSAGCLYVGRLFPTCRLSCLNISPQTSGGSSLTPSPPTPRLFYHCRSAWEMEVDLKLWRSTSWAVTGGMGCLSREYRGRASFGCFPVYFIRFSCIFSSTESFTFSSNIDIFLFWQRLPSETFFPCVFSFMFFSPAPSLCFSPDFAFIPRSRGQIT